MRSGASEVELHPGLVVLRPTGLSAERQWELLQSVLGSIKTLDLANKVVEVYAAGEFELRDLPPR